MTNQKVYKSAEKRYTAIHSDQSNILPNTGGNEFYSNNLAHSATSTFPISTWWSVWSVTENLFW